MAKEETVENGTQKTIEIKMASKSYPNPIAFEAFDEDSGESIVLRDRRKLLLIPRQKKFEEVVIIGMLFFVLFEIFVVFYSSSNEFCKRFGSAFMLNNNHRLFDKKGFNGV